MVLYFIGLGLGDAKDITLRGLEVVKRAKAVYLESYTSILQSTKQEMVCPLHFFVYMSFFHRNLCTVGRLLKRIEHLWSRFFSHLISFILSSLGLWRNDQPCQNGRSCIFGRWWCFLVRFSCLAFFGKNSCILYIVPPHTVISICEQSRRGWKFNLFIMPESWLVSGAVA